MEIHFVSGPATKRKAIKSPKLLTRYFFPQCVPFPRAAERPKLPVELVEVLTNPIKKPTMAKTDSEKLSLIH